MKCEFTSFLCDAVYYAAVTCVENLENRCLFHFLLHLSLNWRHNALWMFVAVTLFVISSGLLFRNWSQMKEYNYWHPNMQRLDLVLATASVSLVTALILIFDLCVTVRFGIQGDLD